MFARDRFRADRRHWLAILAAAFVVSCSKSEAPSPQAAAAPAQPIAVHALTVAPRNVPIRLTVPGQIEGSKQVEVRGRVSGILEKQLYREGDAVKAGTLLFQIDRTPFEVALAQAKGALAQATAQAEQTKREEVRLRPLVAERAVSRKEFDDAVSGRQLAEASVQQASAAVRQAEINLSYTDVTAPVAGITGRAQRSVGTLITIDANGSLLTTIDQLTPIWVRFSLAESDLAKVPGGRIARGMPIEVALALADGSPYPLKGRLNFAASAIDSKLGTQQLRAEFDNPKEELLPGQFVKVTLGAGTRDGVFLVPQAAVIQTEKTYLVFVVDGEGKAQVRNVQVGDWVGSDWAITSGLKTGDRVIVDNLQKVRPGVPVTIVQDAPVAASAAAPK